ncbi:methyl-accepting chemotaxis protein [Paracraurococcus lichenis]|uniref:Methyl-accepting chemotaxis protein n=1 Tax=Paracraurococcus lichenis TaxID=3064888 RepID=A0ABT9E3Y4_9PROT|nr:methyl-accepting chemotaxis protein [Paracraurococcus sp. LOR1-02]MDO9710849.1 methyl-accepting chemotaxis protein [Paracraurococcus sp. LOR1-02]
MTSRDTAKPGFALTIRASLLAALACLAAFGMAALGWQSAADWQELRLARAGEAANAGANRFVAGVLEVLLERLATNNALQAANPASVEARQEIERRRTAVRESFLPGRAALATAAFPGREALLAELDTALVRAEEMRRRADAALPQPREARDPALLKDYLPTITASVNAALRLWYAAVHAIAGQDPVLARLAVIKELGWRLRETSGIERSDAAAAIAAGRPLAPEKLASNAANRTRVDLLWDELRNLVPEADQAVDPALRAAMAEGRRGYFEDFRALVDRMVAAGAAAPGGQYPMAAPAFVATTNPQIDALLGIMHAAGRVSEARAAALVADHRVSLTIALALLALSLAVTGAAGWVVIGRVARPLRRLELATEQLAAGNLGAAIPGAARQDEVGRLAAAILVLRAGLAEKARMEAEQAGAQARAEAETRAAVRHMAEQVETTARSAVADINQRTTAMMADAGALAEMAGGIARSAALVTATTEQVLADTQAGAASAEQLATSIRQVTAQVDGATAAARRAVARTEASQARIASLSEAAARIADVLRLITDIAGRTNLLALNATIEAARAGEAGKGFTVVATEVKALASQTAAATEEIARQVQEIGEATTGTIAAVGEIAAAIRETDAASATIATVMQHQADATSEIAQTVARTAAAAREVTGQIRTVSTAVASAGERANSVREAAVAAEGASSALQTAIVRLIRGASPETDRRLAPRYPGQGRRAQLDPAAPGRPPLVGEIGDISASGAALLLPAGSQPPQPGERASLRIDGVGLPVPVTAAGLDAAGVEGSLRLRLRFDAPDPAVTAALTACLGPAGAARAAA